MDLSGPWSVRIPAGIGLESSKGIRKINQCRPETGKTVEILREGRVAGQVMKARFYDELGVYGTKPVQSSGVTGNGTSTPRLKHRLFDRKPNRYHAGAA